MPEALEHQQVAVSDAEVLLEFLYLTPVGMIRFQLDGTIDLINPVAAQLLMPLAPEANLSNLYQVLSAAVPDLPCRTREFGAAIGAICDQLRVTIPGTDTVFTLSINKINDSILLAVIQDITLAVRRETRIRDDQQRFRAIFENVRDYAIYTVDRDGRVDTWNRSLARIGGWEPSDVIGAPIGMFFLEDLVDQAQSASLLERARQTGKAAFEGWRIRKDGSRFWGDSVASSLPDEQGQANGYVMVTRDLTERKQMEDRLVALSITDPMTGAFNRRAGEAKLEEAFRGWARNGSVFSLLMIDCDHFKSVNDTLGHEAGDEVLIALVRVCQARLRSIDTLFRWGGEEFMVLMPETDGRSAWMVAERLRLALEAEQIAHSGGEVRITVSVGVAEVCAADHTPDEVIRRTDRALYSAKKAGRNQVLLDDGKRQ
jgi:diguanylate cyclase (GGDEF)-like protein/PAS domain S-box-containing protein